MKPVAADAFVVEVLGDGVMVGDRIVPGQDPVRFFEMRLTRVSDSGWPGAGAIPPK